MKRYTKKIKVKTFRVFTWEQVAKAVKVVYKNVGIATPHKPKLIIELKDELHNN